MVNPVIASLIMAIIQGITEWLPISSSAQLEVASRLLSFQNSLIFDVVLHFGTLMAVFIYFSKDIMDIIEDLLRGKWKSQNGRLGILLIIATIPAGIFGLLFHKFFEQSLDNLMFISLGLAITGVVLLIGSLKINKKAKKIIDLTYKDALLIGAAQILALFRGVTRSGTTISSGLLLGLDEKSAVKFSFLLSIPVILGANVVEVGSSTLPANLLWAALVSFAVGIATIHLSFNYILSNRKNLRWLALYVFLLAIGIWIYLIVS